MHGTWLLHAALEGVPRSLAARCCLGTAHWMDAICCAWAAMPRAGARSREIGAGATRLALLLLLAACGAPDPARVFSRYYRAPMATQVSGTGLGLWLSQNLARQMHSEIRLGQQNDGDLPKIMFSFTLELT